MPLKRTIEKARKDKRQGKSPSTQAGEFIHKEIHKIRKNKHGARSPQQAIAIGLFEARRAGVDLPPPKRGRTTERTRESAEYAYEAGQGKRRTHLRPKVSRAVSRILQQEPRSSASHKALSKQSKRAASRRTAASRSAAAYPRAPRQIVANSWSIPVPAKLVSRSRSKRAGTFRRQNAFSESDVS